MSVCDKVKRTIKEYDTYPVYITMTTLSWTKTSINCLCILQSSPQKYNVTAKVFIPLHITSDGQSTFSRLMAGIAFRITKIFRQWCFLPICPQWYHPAPVLEYSILPAGKMGPFSSLSQLSLDTGTLESSANFYPYPNLPNTFSCSSVHHSYPTDRNTPFHKIFEARLLSVQSFSCL